MDKLWAPWRTDYITTISKEEHGCVFCNMIEKNDDQKNLIFIRQEHCFAVLNLYPYNNGHSLILPNRHVDDLSQLKKYEREALFDLLDEVKSLMQETLKPEGFNIGINLGHAAGAGIPGHLHVHIVPRWKGDSNFMPVVGGTKVISQSLQSCYELLNNAYTNRN